MLVQTATQKLKYIIKKWLTNQPFLCIIKITKGKEVDKMFFLGWLIDIILTVVGYVFLGIYFGNSPITFIFFCCFPIPFILIWCKIFEKRG